MNFDMTFCQGARCDKKETCERWTENLRREAAKRKFTLENRPISIAQFADHAGKCEMYIERETPKAGV